jgi:hypothetical protein
MPNFFEFLRSMLEYFYVRFLPVAVCFKMLFSIIFHFFSFNAVAS